MLSLKHPDNFVNRHIGPTESEIKEMLEACGVQSINELIQQTIPQKIRLNENISLEPALSEYDFISFLRNLGSKNKIFKSYIGMGYYPTILPPVIQRNILENPGWYTQYTPYQAEIAQGRLEALLNFQTMVSELTGMKLANASLLDEGTAAAEAMVMFFNLRKKEKQNSVKFFVDQEIFPQTVDVLKSRALGFNIELVIGDHKTQKFDNNFFGLIVQYPSNTGEVNDYRDLFSSADEFGIYKIVAADLLSLALLTPPGEFGADVVVGSTQRFGVPMGYGGPHAGYFATKDEFKRNIPGRVIGISIDAQGNSALRMALQTREQHIRREKATSNICTAQVLLAVIAGMYAAYHGPNGIKRIAEKIHGLTKLLDYGLKGLGFKQINSIYFDTLVIESDKEQIKTIRENSLQKQINLRYFDNSFIGVSLSEITTVSDVIELLNMFADVKGKKLNETEIKKYSESIKLDLPEKFLRTSGYMGHPVFNTYHSETELLRYMKQLENKDLSLVHSMIPLGSCTMKLNATTEMLGVTIPEFSEIHPFAPIDQAEGYQKLFLELENDLSKLTGFAAVSLQPNSGAQGEFSGLSVIRAYHESKGEGHRNIVVIPSSAHGTNPASAVMAGMKVVVVNCDDLGNIDLDDLRKKVEINKNNLSSLMITYPSTHGVFEESIVEICELIHSKGGQVYMDGANLNAQVGLTTPGLIGADVCHLNLHKTFCIPHGGGGPGMGPIAVAEHLTPFLPGHSVININKAKSINAVSAAPWGSASILLISYAYIKLMGSVGLKTATEIAILNANYIKSNLEKHFSVLYSGINGRVAHELIFDMREFKNSAHIEVEDIAKRLMDYGFHAPTVSFPVPGTLMVEPTESESKIELDRFCEALISIKSEIKEIEQGLEDPINNVLKNAPHTIQMVCSDNWTHPYPRAKAAYPLPWTIKHKFWASVARVDNAYGDRNLVCSCLPVSDYNDEPVEV
ncbi:MAG: aminomethyl-transferring glycine dehydrogenase [Ignavibacterium sp.]|nr:aminomethyl-transferring glycine dehydrogenase [Ignavibacterium sp.]